MAGPVLRVVVRVGDAIHRLRASWARRAGRVPTVVPFVGYGGVGGARGVEQLRQILVEFRMVPLRNAVHITMAPYLAVLDNERSLDDFEDLGKRAVTLVALVLVPSVLLMIAAGLIANAETLLSGF